MAELEVLVYPNPILLAEAQAVARVSGRIRRLAHNMLETMSAASGIGLAAPQVGVQERVIVVGVGEDPLVLVNPTIAAAEGEQLGLEGCLSLPDLVGEVRRAAWVTVTGLNGQGWPVRLEGEELLARVLQHEIDHLDGILFVTRVADLNRLWKVSELSATAAKEVTHI